MKQTKLGKMRKRYLARSRRVKEKMIMKKIQARVAMKVELVVVKQVSQALVMVMRSCHH